jgi:hypothetical protein
LEKFDSLIFRQREYKLAFRREAKWYHGEITFPYFVRDHPLSRKGSLLLFDSLSSNSAAAQREGQVTPLYMPK